MPNASGRNNYRAAGNGMAAKNRADNGDAESKRRAAIDRQLRTMRNTRTMVAATGGDTSALDATIAGLEAQRAGRGDGYGEAAAVMQQGLVEQQRRNQELINRANNERMRAAEEQRRLAEAELQRRQALAPAPVISAPAASGNLAVVPSAAPSTATKPPGTNSSIVQTRCLKLSDKAWVGGISTDSTSFINHCNHRVSYVYCVTSQNGGGHFSCTKPNFGAGDVRANGEDAVSVMGADPQFRVHWVECTDRADPNGYVLTTKPRFTNGQIFASCQ